MQIRPFDPADLEAVVRLWHETKRDAYDFLPQERSRALDEDRAFFAAQLLPRCELWLAVAGSQVLGFLGRVGSYVDRLYVRPAVQRRGVGSALLARALALSPHGIELHTHQRNHRARAFYRRHGLRAVRLGLSPPPECEPDVEYHWRPAWAGPTHPTGP